MSEEAPDAKNPGPRGMPRGVKVFVFMVTVAAVGAFVANAWAFDLRSSHALAALGAFYLLLVAAEWMDVRFRLHGEVESLNLSEVILAPFIFSFGGPIVIVIVAISQFTSGAIRKNEPIKVIFNAAQWSCAVGAASAVFEVLRSGNSISTHNMLALLAAMVTIGIVNQLALTSVLRLAQRRTLRSVLHGWSPVIVPGWAIGWALNTLVGFLFVLAFASSPWAVMLFAVPLAVLHAAYRGYAGMESDRMRLAGLHRASRLLAAPGEPYHAVADFLAEVCRCFEAGASELLLVATEGIVIHRVRNGDASTYEKVIDNGGTAGLRAVMVARPDTARITAGDSEDELADVLSAAGWRDCLLAPLPNDNFIPGVLAIYDQDGLEGFEEGEHAVLEALARETASSFEKGKLFAAIVEERHKLSQIVDSTFDGVLTLTAEGTVRSFNPGWEQISGYSGMAVMGRSLSETITIFDLDGLAVPFDLWTTQLEQFPEEIQIIDRHGAARWLQCQYRPEYDDDGSPKVLTIVAHDNTDLRQIEQLREDVDRLAELEAAQRARVLQLQDSLQPDIPVVDDTEFGVYYLPSDTTAPTGGDFFDWQVMPDGNVHIAVVDVLGHGVEATNDALTAIHTLRMLAFQGVAVEDLIRRCDELLSALDPDLVATAIVARYNPQTGHARLAGGGHPPPLLVRANGEVDEIASPGVAIGWPGAGSDGPVDVVLEPTETLVFYTDGLVEAQRDILFGLEALANNAAQTRGLPAPELARALVERSLEGAARRDDSLALVVRNCAVADPFTGDRSHFGFDHRGEPRAEEVPEVRHRFISWLNQQPVNDDLRDELAIVVSELVTNAVRAASRFYELRATRSAGGITIEVEDDGPGFEPELSALGGIDFEEESGRGLMIVRSLVDDIHVRDTGAGSLVHLYKQLDAPPSNPVAQSPEVQPATH